MRSVTLWPTNDFSTTPSHSSPPLGRLFGKTRRLPAAPGRLSATTSHLPMALGRLPPTPRRFFVAKGHSPAAPSHLPMTKCHLYPQQVIYHPQNVIYQVQKVILRLVYQVDFMRVCSRSAANVAKKRQLAVLRQGRAVSPLTAAAWANGKAAEGCRTPRRCAQSEDNQSRLTSCSAPVLPTP